MNSNFLIIKKMKEFINNIDDITIIIPNRDRVLKDRMYNTSYDILYYLYNANYGNKKDNIIYILSYISMLDFYLERCLKKKYINSKMCEKKCNSLREITKMVYGWAKYES